MPETKGKTLEELDQVFGVPSRIHAAYGLRQIPYFFRRYILWQHIEPERLYKREDIEGNDTSYSLEQEHEPEKRA